MSGIRSSRSMRMARRTRLATPARPLLAGWYNYAPITGQRDILGYIRAPQATNPGAGYGGNPFIDIGAYQYVNLHPPEVTDVREVPVRRGRGSRVLLGGRDLGRQHDALAN